MNIFLYRSLILLIFLVVGLIVTTSCKPPSHETFLRTPVIETVAQNLQSPWSIAKMNRTFYISERNGTIAKIENGKMIRQKLFLIKPVYQQNEGGFLGLVLSPDFATSHLAYAYHTYMDGNQIRNRVIRVIEKDKGWIESKSLLEKIPGASNHNGGRLAIGPDQHLYVTTGDAAQEMEAQNRNSLAGKILRMTLSGDVPSDNPIPGTYVYSYGHRNPQGLDWDQSGNLYASDHGPIGQDEINKIVAGGNYGWPFVQGDQQREGLISPLYQSGTDTWAPSGLKVTQDNEMVVATLRGQKLLKFEINEKRVEPLLEGEGRLRDVYIENGEIYILTNNTDGRGNPAKNDDRLLRLR